MTLAFHVGRNNRRDLESLIALSAELNLDFKVSPIRPVGRALDQMPDAILDCEAYRQVVEVVTGARLRYPGMWLTTDFDLLEPATTPAASRGAAGEACKAGRAMLHIASDGHVYPCAFLADERRTFSAGSIHEQDLATLWRDAPQFQPFRRQRKGAHCQDCRHYRHRCVGGCPALAWAHSGRIDADDPLCFMGRES